MRKFGMFAAVAVSVLALSVATPVQAESMTDALSRAYTTNPDLMAAQAQLRAIDEQAALARSGFRPSLSASASIAAVTEESSAADDDYTSRSGKLELSQPLFRGGRTLAAIREADSAIAAGRANLLSAEQQLMLGGIQAYLGVLRDQSVLELNRNNEAVLTRQLQAARDRFSVGDVTRTDVSQAEARLSRARASRVQAEAALIDSRANYRSIFGVMPEADLKLPDTAGFALPGTVDDAVAEAEANNPGLVAAAKNRDVAEAALSGVKGERLPTVAAVGTLSRSYDAGSSAADRQDTASAMLRMTWPIYDGGATSSRIRAAKQDVARSGSVRDSAQRTAVQVATSAWLQLETATATRQSREAQVQAAQIALDGVREEEQVGSRTVLDTLNAEQELLDARVALVTAQHDEILSRYQLLSAVGRLTARELKLPVEYYDETAYASRVRHKFIGSGVE